MTDTIGRQVDRHSVDSRLTSRSIVGRLPVAMLLTVGRRNRSIPVRYVGRHLADTSTVTLRSTVGSVLSVGGVSVDCRWYVLFWNGSRLRVGQEATDFV